MPVGMIVPSIQPPLDRNFCPAVTANHIFQQGVKGLGARAVIGLERSSNEFSRFETDIFPEDHPGFEANYEYLERIVKFLLWQRGGHTIYIGGPRQVADYIRQAYSANGIRKFDYHFVGEQVYEREFSIVSCNTDEVPAERENGKILGRNFNGHRIGFDLGASDRKISAVVDGMPIYSEEVIWEPRNNSDPAYHYHEITAALKTQPARCLAWTQSVEVQQAYLSIIVRWLHHCFEEYQRKNSVRSRTCSCALERNGTSHWK
jgi:hypothetical protein